MGSYRNIALVISNLLEPVLTGDTCKDIRANVMCLTNASYLDDQLHTAKGAWVQAQELVLEDGSIKEYRVHLEVSFILND
jgi:hypothetical protein